MCHCSFSVEIVVKLYVENGNLGTSNVTIKSYGWWLILSAVCHLLLNDVIGSPVCVKCKPVQGFTKRRALRGRKWKSSTSSSSLSATSRTNKCKAFSLRPPFFARAGLFAHTRAVSMNQFTDLRYNLTIMVPQITQTLLKKLALSLDWGPNLSVWNRFIIGTKYIPA